MFYYYGQTVAVPIAVACARAAPEPSTHQYPKLPSGTLSGEDTAHAEAELLHVVVPPEALLVAVIAESIRVSEHTPRYPVGDVS